MDVYNQINILCIEKGLTGKQLGELLGLKKSPMTDWKNGKAKPTVEQIMKMCEIFAISADYILFGKSADELSIEEQKLVEAYRRADEKGKEAIIATSKIFSPEPEQETLSTSRTG